MDFESLANELLLDLFEYLTAVHLLRAFHGLNSRFNTLIVSHFRAYRLDFHSIYKYESDIVCQQHLPLIIDRIISLRLSDDDDNTPEQTALFHSLTVKLRQFTHLRSLSLCHLCPSEMYNILNECHHKLYHLTHLNLIKYNVNYQYAQPLSNLIWSLRTLTHLRVEHNRGFLMPKVMSPSLGYLSIVGPCNVLHYRTELADLFRRTPHLQCFQVSLNDRDDHRQLLSSIPSITSLKLYDIHVPNMMMSILENMPNLYCLVVQTYDIKMNGHQWQQTIVDHLPKLRIFRLKMKIQIKDNENNEHEIDKLIDSFRSRFWLDEHQWFIRCHWIPQDNYSDILLYTLPYTFANFDTDRGSILFKTTLPHDNDQCMYDRVHNLSYHCLIFSDSIISHIRFLNIRYLSVKLPFDKHFWNIVSKLDQLVSLCVSSSDYDAQSQLQALLDQSPNLYSLIVNSWPSSQIPLVENTSVSLRRLDLRMLKRSTKDYYDSFFNSQECDTLIRSPFGIQCEVLLIKIENRDDVLHLINRMINLRVLNVQCKSTECMSTYSQWMSNVNKLIEWLQQQLFPTYTVTRYKENDDYEDNDHLPTYGCIVIKN